jgi:hypothetical protein
MLNLFDDLEIETHGDRLVGLGSNLERLGALLRNQRIRAAAREVMLGAIRGDRMVLHLNKQAAYAGKVNFSAESPLGELLVEIRDENLEGLVDRVAPATIAPGGP